MRVFSKGLRAVRAAVVVAFGLVVGTSFAAQMELTEYVVPSGETLEMGSTQTDAPGTNDVSCLVDLRSDATLRLTMPYTGTAAYVWSSLIVTDGPATIELADGITEVAFYGNTIVRKSLTIKGKDLTKVYFKDRNAETGGYTTSTAQYDFSGGLTFEDGAGTPITPTVSFSKYGTYLTAPLPSWTFTAGDMFYLAGENVYGTQSEIVYDSNYKFKAALVNPNAVSSSQTFRLGQWRAVLMSPATVPDFATTHDKTWTYCDATYSFNVAMEHADAEFRFYSTKDVTFTGSLSGPGNLTASSTGSENIGTARFYGNLSGFTGRVTVDVSQNLVFNQSVPNDMTIYANGSVSFQAATEDDNVSSITLGTVNGMGSATQTARICGTNDQTITIGRVQGNLRLSVPEGEHATFNILAWDDGVIIRQDPGATVTFAGASVPPKCVVFLPAGSQIYDCVLPDANGVATIPSGFRQPADAAGYMTFGDVKVAGLPVGCALTSGDGNTPVVVADAATPTYVAAQTETTVQVVPRIGDWRNTAMLWIDPSRTETHCQHYKAEGSGTSTTEGTTPSDLVTVSPDKNCKVVHGLIDVRGADAVSLRLWNARPWMRQTYYEEVATVLPYVATDCAPVEGLAYLAFGNSVSTRRIQFTDYAGVTSDYQTYNNSWTISPKFVIMVYGSQKGGGYSVIATSNGLFKRTNSTEKASIQAIKASDPITLNDTGANMWLNGRSIDPTTTGLSGEWDIIAIDLSNVSAVYGFGGDANSSANSYCGSKYLGETIFLSSVPDDVTRRDIERYLAQRWNLMSKYTDAKPAVQTRLAGSGMVSLPTACQATLTGSFAGNLNLGAGVTATFSGTAPYRESEIGALNPAFWIDPDATDAIKYDDATTRTVGNLYQHDPDKRTIGTDLFLTSNHGGRAPVALRQARGLGPVRTWIDYDGTNETATSQGNVLRIHRVDDSESTSDVTIDVQMGFIVQDSVRGGGTPFLQNVGASGDVARRQTANYADAIYASGTTRKLKNGSVYLNGASVNHANGFLGRAELFTFTATATTSIGAFAWYNNSEKGNRWGEIQGEILLFASPLGETPRQRVEAYLMQKWLGWMPAGFVDYTKATVTGEGSLTVANLGVAPKLGETFTGTMTVQSLEPYPMTLVRGATAADDSVEGAIIAPSATLSLPAAVTMNVACAERPRPGRYTLLDVASVGETEFSLDSESSVLTYREDAVLQQNGGKVELVIPSHGMMFILK